MGAADDARDAAAEEMELDGGERHRDKERRERHRREEKDHHGSGRRDREKDKDDRRREKDDSKHRDRDRDRDSKHRDRDKEPERDRGRDRDRGKDREREREQPDRQRDKDRGKDREKEPDRERDKERERRDRDKERSRNRDNDKDRAERGDKEREGREHEKSRGKGRGEDDADSSKGDQKLRVDASVDAEQPAAAELRERIARAKEERLKDKKEGGILDGDDGASEILSWVGKSRKLDEKRQAEKEKALRLARALEEQDNILAENGDDDDEEEDKQVGDHLSGVKVLHGLDKVLEGGAVVMTLKDQSILANGDINEDADMLENIEIGEQKQRDEAYKASKKKGTYDDKFNDDPSSKKSMLSHYDDPMEDEGVTLDEGGRFTGEAEKKLEELRKRIEGGFVQKKTVDLTSTTKMTTDYFTPDEMLQFKKPKKKKSLRKKEKLDLDALEAEAIASGLGAADLGSRKDGKRQSAREAEQAADAEKRSSAYQAAIAKAEEASKALREEKTVPTKPVEEELVFGDDYEDLQKSLEQARKLAIRKQEEAAASGPLAVVELATATKGQEHADATEEDSQQNKVVITEMEEFVWGLQLNQGTRKPEDDVFMDEDDDARPSGNLAKDDTNGLAAMEEDAPKETAVKVEEEEIKPDEVIHEAAVGKGLAGALKILKERGSLNEGTDWGGRTTDKKKSKLVGVEDGPKDIRIERMDEFGRVMTPKEAFRDLSHKFHGKGPGKMKQEKRQKKYLDELKTKRMKSSDTPLMAAEKMREAQARNQTPYLILSGNAKTSQTSDASGFAALETEHPGSLTPMLGEKKVEHFLGIKRSAKPGGLPPPVPKKPKN
ncbi:hypothetical protein U9M48_015979 [Paspalum notatum var. saurae]|uniref:SART-1 family protein DOT2 n=1 Tax=Paspalum notatum var. saurae TaxID=547442 RepID=A0AAQ3T4L3_PASNO